MTDFPKQSEMALRKVFLCHSSGDKEEVRRLYRILRENGLDPWLDEENLLGGQDWQLEIAKAVRRSDAVVVCLSADSLAKTGYVQRELRFALDVADEQPEGKIFIIPVRLEDCEIPERLGRWHCIDLFRRDGPARLLKTLGVGGAGVPAGTGPAKLRLTVHRGYFAVSGVECFFLNATNLSARDELEMTHVWLETIPPFYIMHKDRPLPKRLKPQETWETWVRTNDVQWEKAQEASTLARARLSTGVVVHSVANEEVPEVGTVPGGPVTRV